MGAWGAGVFQNDSALDWKSDLLEADGEFLVRSLKLTATNQGYLDVDDGSAGLAAAEVVALMGGVGSEGMDPELEAWISRSSLTVRESLVASAIRVVERVRGHDSELAELWDGNEEWAATLENLTARLKRVRSDRPG